ncbi:hypothetical protein [Chryseobacterium wangxinyae]|uniref:hypothetical protein n=1 Tax=Chryseobacterium sp. CY353 TaxID=2997334 RepID=UPI002271FE56|nr:hypothetical protein [Chryseobacterium sp. CY353]MCY0967969.1 hypothetical protein [Chryseobacterium sp. CY353]
MDKFAWITDKLKSDKKIKSIKVKGRILFITRDDYYKLQIIAIDDSFIDKNKVAELIQGEEVNYILTTDKNCFITGDVFEYLNNEKIVIGDFGDIFRILKKHQFFPYLNPTIKFVTQGLQQHDKVKDIVRLSKSTFLIERIIYEPVKILVLEDYNISIQSVRGAIEMFDKFDCILKFNPNGGIADNAYNLANEKKFKILKWGELLGELNKKWK